MGSLLVYIFVGVLAWLIGMAVVALIFQEHASIAMGFYSGVTMIVLGVLLLSDEIQYDIIVAMEPNSFKAIEGAKTAFDVVGTCFIVGGIVDIIVSACKVGSSPTRTAPYTERRSCATCHLKGSTYCSTCTSGGTTHTTYGSTPPATHTPPTITYNISSSSGKPLFCPHCGKRRVDGEPFCTYCGTKIDK